jgi:hypothetical protein
MSGDRYNGKNVNFSDSFSDAGGAWKKKLTEEIGRVRK